MMARECFLVMFNKFKQYKENRGWNTNMYIKVKY